jgi:hypothetical protein
MAPLWAWRRHGTKSRPYSAAFRFARFKISDTKDQTDSTSPLRAKGRRMGNLSPTDRTRSSHWGVYAGSSPWESARRTE